MPDWKLFVRCVESQAYKPIRKVTETTEEADFLERFIEDSKPAYPMATGYHFLIQTPFRYPLPIPERFEARFKPAFHERNVFYASEEMITALHEASFYFLRERVSKAISQNLEPRTKFESTVDIEDSSDLRNHENVSSLMNRNDYSASQAYVKEHESVEVILYPSCRCPDRGTNAAVFILERMGRSINKEQELDFSFDRFNNSVKIYFGQKMITHVFWDDLK